MLEDIKAHLIVTEKISEIGDKVGHAQNILWPKSPMQPIPDDVVKAIIDDCFEIAKLAFELKEYLRGADDGQGTQEKDCMADAVQDF